MRNPSKWLDNPSLRRVFGTTVWLQAEKVWQMAIGLAVGIWMARYLGPEQFGIWSYALAIVAIVIALGRMGVDQILMREFSLAEVPPGPMLGAGILLRLFGTLAFALLAWVGISLFQGDDELVLILLAFMLPAAVLRAPENAEFLHVVQGQGRRIFLARGLPLALGAAIKVVLIVLDCPLPAFGVAVLIEAAFLSLTFLVSIRNFLNNKIIPPITLVGKALKDSFPILLSSAAVMIYMRVDMVMLGAMSTKEEVGIYAIAVRVSEAWYIIPITIIHAATASLLRAKETRGITKYQERLRQQFQFLIVLSYVASAIVTVLSEPLVQALFGEEYTKSSLILSLYVWASAFIVLSTGSTAYLVNERQNWVLPIRTGVGALINVVANYFLIPKYGALGATYATLISYAIAGWIAHCAFNSVTRNLFLLQARSLLLLDLGLLAKGLHEIIGFRRDNKAKK